MTIRSKDYVDDPFAAELMDSYLEGRKEDVRLLERAVENRNFELVRMIGHNLFGSGGAYGLEALSEIGERLETAATSEKTQEIRSAIEDLRQAIEK